MRIDDSGNFVAREVGLLVARQNGKSHIMRIRLLFGIFVLGEKWVTMAQKLELAESHLEWAIEVIAKNPELATQVKKISRTNGRKFIQLKNGGRWAISAATADSIRGNTGNLWVDELREIKPEAWSAATPVTRAVQNSQIYVSSNAGDANSEVLNRFRAGAISADSPKSLWLEWSADPALPISDPETWAQANPAMNLLIDQDKIELAFLKDTKAEFLTESLCLWIDSIESPWAVGSLEACANPELELDTEAPTYWGLDVTPNRTRADLVCAQQLPSGKIAVSLAASWNSSSSVDDMKIASDIAELVRKFNSQLVAFDKWTASAVAARLAGAGILAKDTSGAMFAQACDQMLNALNSGRMVHDSQPELIQHFNACAKKSLADGGWRVVRSKSSEDISIACASIMALHYASKSQPEISVMFG